jgi:hypothetical protein
LANTATPQLKTDAHTKANLLNSKYGKLLCKPQMHKSSTSLHGVTQDVWSMARTARKEKKQKKAAAGIGFMGAFPAWAAHTVPGSPHRCACLAT